MQVLIKKAYQTKKQPEHRAWKRKGKEMRKRGIREKEGRERKGERKQRKSKERKKQAGLPEDGVPEEKDTVETSAEGAEVTFFNFNFQHHIIIYKIISFQQS